MYMDGNRIWSVIIVIYLSGEWHNKKKENYYSFRLQNISSKIERRLPIDDALHTATCSRVGDFAVVVHALRSTQK